ncbi:Na+/H+ antiporter NhaC [Neisseria montereyensis]|uniref:Na+/H+ antiporter NhaC n=1 Tax=Neisseria montereyensis TaxID=2973938 RepID=A0ABT2FCT9_9NEIS|nr:Na+/H+ antiporter NhaC [Neisseria montereyensis]MCS4533549.1 Na+/H+ antiporter NhaC [Neisseria montereyensis]
MREPLLTIRTGEAVMAAVLIVAVMGVTMIGFEWIPHLSVILVVCGLLAFGKFKGIRFQDMQDGMASGVMSGIGAIYLFFFIGLLVSAMMMSGSIPTLMYYGFDLISPKLFYLSAFALTSVVGVSIGSSLTTCATLGVAFLGMGEAFDANPAIVAGAVVSGAFFGDKMSPLSDTTSIAASIVGIDLFEHIRNMMYTTLPAWILTAIFFWMLSGNSAQADIAGIQEYRANLEATGLIHGYALLPFAVLLLLVLRKINAIYAIIITIIVSLIITYFHSHISIDQLGGYFFSGYKPAEGLEIGDVAKLISRGGVNSMFFTQTIVILALSLGGLLNALGILPALMQGIAHLLTNAGRATFTVAATSLSVNVLIGEQYLSLLLSGNTFKPVYERLGLHPRNIARTIEDAGTVMNPLVPWSVCGVFISSVLDVPVLSYLPYAFFCYLCLILTLIFGFTGVTLSQADE